MQAGRQIRVNEIADLLSKGVKRKGIIQQIEKKYKVGQAIIDRDIAAAKPIALERQQKINEKRQLQISNHIEGQDLQNLLSDTDLELILSQIACGNVQIETWRAGVAILRGVTAFEVIAAIDKLFKKRGSYPEIELRLKGKGNKTPIDLSKYEVIFK